MGRKKAAAKDMPVDQLDLFFRRHYKTILSTAFIAIAVFVLGYGVYSIYGKNRSGRIETIGMAEIAGLSTKEQIIEYEGLADTNAFAKDYISMIAAERWMAIGDNESAKAALAKVGGYFTEYADSLGYDLGDIKEIDSQLMNAGELGPLWYYRAVLAAPDASRGALIAQFRAAWPDSLLLAQLDKWGIR